MANEAMTLQVDSVGLVELGGEGPWIVHEINRNSFDIKDSTGKVCNPAVTAVSRSGRGTKRNQNVVYANKSIPNVIVKAFNEALAKAAA